MVYSTKLLKGKPNPGDPAIGSEFSGLEVIDAKIFAIGVNSLIGMSLRGSPGNRCANADNAILAFCSAGTVSDLGKINAHHFSKFRVLPQAVNLRKR